MESPFTRPHAPGKPFLFDPPLALSAVPTPALVLDEPALERNVAKMQAHLTSFGKAARPHTKTHKCPELARRQLGAGAVGVCCAKVGEAEAMVAGGVDRVLVTSPIVCEEKAERFVTLCRDAGALAEILVVVDSELGLERLAVAALRHGIEVDVLVDLDPGVHRTGVALGEAAVRFAERVHVAQGVRLRGLQAYAGHLQHVAGFAERRARSLAIWHEVLATHRAIRARGIELPLLTGSGTGTFDIDTEVGEISDLQVGSYVFMDLEYRAIGSREGELFAPFETALWVLATAISQPVPGRITIDAGFKAFATDSVRPTLLDVEGVRYHWGGDEHGILELVAASRPIELGDRLRVAVPHCDPTVNLYDGFWVQRNGRIVAWWPITGRGRSQ